MYIYTIKENKAVLLSQHSSYEQETYPARIYLSNTYIGA